MLNESLLKYIQALTAADRKTLGQKSLKTMAEAGELAQKVLSFENAHLARHRFVERQDIIEECVDTILGALSVAFDVQATPDELEDMFVRKTQKWGLLQERETSVKDILPYELHVTVATASTPEAFRDTCRELGVKPIFLALQNVAGNHLLHDVMTSSVFTGDNRQAGAELERICKGLAASGYDVVRRKIETVPWHPAAPSQKNGVSAMPPGCYFESHVSVLVDAETEEALATKKEALRRVAVAHRAHLSRNAFKQVAPLAYTLMVTLRDYDTQRESFEQARDSLVGALHVDGFQPDKVITEFSLFDSKCNHDKAWLMANSQT